MFVTYDVPQHAETVRAHKERKEGKRRGSTSPVLAHNERRSSSSTTNPYSTHNSARADANINTVNVSEPFDSSEAPPQTSSKFGFWRRKNKDVKEILDSSQHIKGRSSSFPDHTSGVAEPRPSWTESSRQQGPVELAASPSTRYRRNDQGPYSRHAIFAEPEPLAELPGDPYVSEKNLVSATVTSSPPLWEHPAFRSQRLSNTTPLLSQPKSVSPQNRTQHLPVRSLRASNASLVSSQPNSSIANHPGQVQSSLRQTNSSIQLDHGSSYSDASTSIGDSSQNVFANIQIACEDAILEDVNPSLSHAFPNAENHTSRLEIGDQNDQYHKKAHWSPQTASFSHAFANMDSANPQIISSRLGENWTGNGDKNSNAELHFEKRLWGLIAYGRLVHGKHLSSPTHEKMLDSTAADSRRVLHIHGSLADGWIIAARYPSIAVYSVLCTRHSRPHPSTRHSAPLNHHSLYTPNPIAPLPFPNDHFDTIISHSLTSILNNNDYTSVFRECIRVLKPGGRIDILSMDPSLYHQGPLLKAWLESNLIARLEQHGKSVLPSTSIVDVMSIVGFQDIRRARIALPASLTTSTLGKNNPQIEMLTYLGRHTFSELYGHFVRIGEQWSEDWFWCQEAINEECERCESKMILTIACAMKPDMGSQC